MLRTSEGEPVNLLSLAQDNGFTAPKWYDPTLVKTIPSDSNDQFLKMVIRQTYSSRNYEFDISCRKGRSYNGSLIQPVILDVQGFIERFASLDSYNGDNLDVRFFHHRQPPYPQTEYYAVDYRFTHPEGQIAELTAASLREHVMVEGRVNTKVPQDVFGEPRGREKFLEETRLPEQVDLLRTVRAYLLGRVPTPEGEEVPLTPETFVKYPLLPPIGA